jgi:hypothetical protein
MTNDRTAIARLLEFWLERAGKEDGFGNRVRITDMITHEAIDVVKRFDLLREFDPPFSESSPFSALTSCCCELDRPRLRLIQGGRQ